MGSNPGFALKISYTHTRGPERGGLTCPGWPGTRERAWDGLSGRLDGDRTFATPRVEPRPCVGSASFLRSTRDPYRGCNLYTTTARLPLGATDHHRARVGPCWAPRACTTSQHFLDRIRESGLAPSLALVRAARLRRGCCVQVALLVRVAGALRAGGRSYTRAGFNPWSS